MGSDNSGTHLDKNPFKRAMDSGIPNATEISQKVTDALYSKRLLDIRIQAAYDYYNPKNILLQEEAAKQKRDVIAKVADTKVVKLTVKGLKTNVHAWFLGIENEYAIGTEEYDRLLIGGTKTFYGVSRANLLIRCNALITAIGSDASLAAVKLLVEAFVATFLEKKATQTDDMTSVKLNTTDINVYGMFMQVY